MNVFLTSFGPPPYPPDQHYLSAIVRHQKWQWAPQLEEADVVFVSVYGTSNVDPAAMDAFCRAPKPVVVLDWLEGPCWDTPNDAHRIFLGRPGFTGTPVLVRLHEILAGHIICYFKRELRAGETLHGSYPVYPLDYPACCSMPCAAQPLEDFLRRPIAVLMCCAFTSVCRLRLFGELIRRPICGTFSFSLPDVTARLNRGTTRIIALLNSLERIPVETVFELQEKSWITVSLRGAGRKCMRDTEAAANSCAAFQAPEKYERAYPWIGGNNCVSLQDLPNMDFIAETEAAAQLEALTLQPEALHPLYANGLINRARYFYRDYPLTHMLPLLEKVL